MGRFEIAGGGAVAFVEYERSGGGRIALLHTEVPEALSGQGVGSKLVRGVRDALRADGAKVEPRCESWPPSWSATPSTGTCWPTRAEAAPQSGFRPASETPFAFPPARVPRFGPVIRVSMARPTAQASSADR